MSMQYVLTEFSDYYYKHVNQQHEVDSSYQDKLRVSGLPYCGLKHLYKRLVQPTEFTSMGMDYYTGVGTLAHSITQHSLGYGKRIYGNWACRSDGCQGARIFSNNHRCPVCKSIMEYREFLLDLRNIFPNLSICLLDGVYRDSNGDYFVIDYKTTNSKTASLPRDKTYLPYLANIAQVKAYCALIELRFNIVIKGWILHYIARDKPTHIYKPFGEFISTKEKKSILNNIAQYSKHYGIVMNCTDTKSIQLLVKEKPCKSIEDYEANYKNFNGCPLAQICFEKKLLNKELYRLWDEREPNFLEWKRPPHLALPKL